MLAIAWIYWDPKPEIFTIPGLSWPILWYGALFALGFILAFPIFTHILVRYWGDAEPLGERKKKANFLADKLTLYIVLGTVVGARLGHFLFYEHPSDYLKDPIEILQIWKGGLASHGAVVGIILAVVLFSYRNKGLGSIRLLDFLSVPAPLCSALIRLGNFFNQEILGVKTDVPWAIVFGHPADRSLPAPRHPVQLYECFFYFALFLLLWRLSYKPSFLYAKGKLFGLLLILVFGFRFLIEFLKTEQSQLISIGSYLTMGQYLSIPLVVLGLLFYFLKR